VVGAYRRWSNGKRKKTHCNGASHTRLPYELPCAHRANNPSKHAGCASQGSVNHLGAVPGSRWCLLDRSGIRPAFTNGLLKLSKTERHGPTRLDWRGASLCGRVI
jgi:hypothetical protein